MISIGLPQENMNLKILTQEQAKLFNMPKHYLNVGCFFMSTLVGFFSIGNLNNKMELFTFHCIYTNLPFVARRLVKFVQSYLLASKCGYIVMHYNRNWYRPSKEQGLSYFKNYFRLIEEGSNKNIRQFILLPL